MNKHQYYQLILFFWIILYTNPTYLISQQTVGLFMNTQESFNGYTLFNPIPSTTTYLIDNCGEIVHNWTSTYRPAVSVYLLNDGTLLRTKNLNNNYFDGGGSGGGIEMLNWDGDVIWEYQISSSTECQHHDIEYLPNGNILIISWDSKTSAEATQAGRSTTGSNLWSEKIIEIEPDLINGGGNIVWQWNAWDHLIQDVDSTKDNYGNVSSYPELININYYSGDPLNPDWLHFNSIDYNESLDQIILSSHTFSEVWIIDHSTTTAEAATHSGGNSNIGGDLLYRWGNPQTYDQGTNSDQRLFKQHDAYWIEDSLFDAGKIMIFNNQAGGQLVNYSEVNIIDPEINNDGSYAYNGGAYGPNSFHWTYQASNPTDFFGKIISGAQRLPDGNTLICEGPTGRLFEVNYSGDIVWEYINPVSSQGIVNQGTQIDMNMVFRCTRYSPSHPALVNRTLTPKGHIETGSTFSCDLYNTSIDENIYETLNIYPNPSNTSIKVNGINRDEFSIKIIDLEGNLVSLTENNSNIDISNLSKGLYFLNIFTKEASKSYKLIKY